MSFFNHDAHPAIRKEREKRTIEREVAASASLANKEEGTELLTSNLPSVFRLFFRSPQSCLIYTGYITVIFRESHSIISLSLLVRLFYLARLPCHPTLFSLPSPTDGLISKCSGKAGQYIILAVSLFLHPESYLAARKTWTRS